MSKKNADLPRLALEFLRVHPYRKYQRTVKAFYRWMAEWKLGLKEIRPAHIKSFIRCPRGKAVAPGTEYEYRRHLTTYLIWLHGKGRLRFNPQCLSKMPAVVLPQTAAQYIRTLEPTRKKNTVNGYRTSLHLFHRWLDERELSIDMLRRTQMTKWLRHLSDSELAPVTINHHIDFVRLYLEWSYEEGLISTHPLILLRISDRVKVPKYLPRPLPPAADRELQARLASADDIYSLGLLLMRKTGLRIGELMALESDCLRSDHFGNHFLKVPLGKLNTERLVPLDDSAIALIDRLRETGEQDRKKIFLIETELGKKTRYDQYTLPLKKACIGLETNGSMVSHRLRHTYATTLLNAGMSLVGVMKLLGHNDISMTLRYAKITQKTVGREYFEALSRLEHRYNDPLQQADLHPTDPTKMLSDVARLIQNRCADDNNRKTAAQSITKRIHRLQRDIQKLFPHPRSKF